MKCIKNTVRQKQLLTFGITLNQYIQIKKVNHSKELIKKGVSFSHIAYECGFIDQSYMIKVFKKYHRYTPSKLNN